MPAPTSIIVREIPLFPMPEVVLFPEAELPLCIYENHYRLMLAELHKSDGQFGVLMLDKTTQKAFTVGCATAVEKTTYLPNGQINILTKGLTRFKLLKITENKPYLVGLVKSVIDEPEENDLVGLQQEAQSLIVEIIRLTNKLTNNLLRGGVNTQIRLPVNLPSNPESFSYWIANNLFSNPEEKQVLLEITNTETRLLQEIIGLKELSKELAARAAIEDAFN